MVEVREKTPTDEVTGLPYCFAPNPDLAPIPRRGELNLVRLGDWNHQFPRANVLRSEHRVLEGLGKLALLNLRGQWVSYEHHHYRYNIEFDDPDYPANEQQLFTTLVMGVAGDVPEGALDFSGAKTKIRKIKPEERRLLWESGQIKIISESAVREYLREYVFQQDLDHLRINEIDEFLHTYDYDKRIYLAHALSAKIVERAVEPIESIYTERRKKGLLHPAAPNNVRDFVKPKLSASRFGPVFSELQKTLGAHKRQLKAEQEPLAA